MAKKSSSEATSDHDNDAIDAPEAKSSGPDKSKSDKAVAKKSEAKSDAKKPGKGRVKVLGPKTVAKPCLVGAALLSLLQVALPR